MRIFSPSILALAAGAALASAAFAQTRGSGYDPGVAFAETDSNKDGYVDYHEFIERITEVYYLNDADKDGKLSAAEATGTLVVTDNLLAADGNGDGNLTVHEFIRARLKDFDAADTNHDGLLSLDEVITAYQKGKQ